MYKRSIKKVIMFSDVEIDNRINLFFLFLEDVDIKKMQLSSMVSSGGKK